MMDVMSKRCEVAGCSKIPSFGLPSKHACRCARHAENGMVNVVSKRCEAPGCGKVNPSYGPPGGPRKYCSAHPGPGDVNLAAVFYNSALRDGAECVGGGHILFQGGTHTAATPHRTLQSLPPAQAVVHHQLTLHREARRQIHHPLLPLHRRLGHLQIHHLLARHHLDANTTTLTITAQSHHPSPPPRPRPSLSPRAAPRSGIPAHLNPCDGRSIHFSHGRWSPRPPDVLPCPPRADGAATLVPPAPA